DERCENALPIFGVVLDDWNPHKRNSGTSMPFGRTGPPSFSRTDIGDDGHDGDDEDDDEDHDVLP
ncbi:hypothetical protein N9L19_00820, partial [bacterium]|nr:hypothetical protein [bacterium]